MPYVSQEQRRSLDPTKRDPVTISFRPAENPGELNYQITRLLDEYLINHQPINYAIMNEVVGVLECAKLEFYRRLMTPYEDTKIEDHGDVYVSAAIQANRREWDLKDRKKL